MVSATTEHFDASTQHLVHVRLNNTYDCGRQSEFMVAVQPPATHADVDGWWNEVVQPYTGDGHPCGSRENALYSAKVVSTPRDHRVLKVGDKYEWMG